MATFRYPVILEKGQRNYGVYAPDLPGCISTGYTPEGSLRNMQEGIAYASGNYARRWRCDSSSLTN
jgi:predicted RNase H-like HicB family nuclease